MSLEENGKQCPIKFDHESPAHAARWPDVYDEMRRHCPMAWSGEHGGYWIATRYDDVVAVAQDSEKYSSSKSFDDKTGAVIGGVAIPAVPVPRGLPVESDGEEWRRFRAYLNNRFGPKAAEGRRARARQFVDALLDMVIETGRIDLVNELTGPVPAMITMELMGLPLREWRQFADPLHAMAYTPVGAPERERVIKDMSWIFERCLQEFARYRKEPQGDGLLSYFAHQKVGGRFVNEQEVMSLCLNIIVGGVDTTTALTTNALVHLFQHPDEKEALMRDRTRIPVAREEFLRFFTPIHGVGRNVMANTALGGIDLEKGDHVYLPLSAANRDPAKFIEPGKIDITRFPNPHVAFGAGSHRCIGSFYARMMFEEMVNGVLNRIPDYKVDLSKAQKYPSVGIINGWIDMPTTFTPGPKVGAIISTDV